MMTRQCFFFITEEKEITFDIIFLTESFKALALSFPCINVCLL